MKLKPDQEKVKNLLCETMLLLCKNSLTFQKQIKVEGLIGITLDDSEVFIIRIDENLEDNFDDSVRNEIESECYPDEYYTVEKKRIKHRPNKRKSMAPAHIVSSTSNTDNHLIHEFIDCDLGTAVPSLTDTGSGNSQWEKSVDIARSEDHDNGSSKNTDQSVTVAVSGGDEDETSRERQISKLESIESESSHSFEFPVKTEPQDSVNVQQPDVKSLSVLAVENARQDLINKLKYVVPRIINRHKESTAENKSEVAATADPPQTSSPVLSMEFMKQAQNETRINMDVTTADSLSPVSYDIYNTSYSTLKAGHNYEYGDSDSCSEHMPETGKYPSDTHLTDQPTSMDMLSDREKSGNSFLSTASFREQNFDAARWSPPRRRPTFAANKEFICRFPGCNRAYYDKKNLLRHQTNEHGRVPSWRRGKLRGFVENSFSTITTNSVDVGQISPQH